MSESLGFCKGCGEEGDFEDNICDKCFHEEYEKQRQDEADYQYRWENS